MFLDKQKGGSRRGGCASYAVFALSIFVLAAFVFVSVVFDLSFCIFTCFFCICTSPGDKEEEKREGGCGSGDSFGVGGHQASG